MGHGTSISRGQPAQQMVASAELQEGCRKLSRDLNFRQAFVCFIKSGEWLDQLVVLVPQGQFVLDVLLPGKFGTTKSVCSDYRMTKEKLLEVESVISAASHKSITWSTSTPSTPRTPNSFRPNQTRLELYFNIDESPCFSGDQYLGVLFHILYPIYLGSPQYRRFLKRGIEHGRAQRDEDDGSMSCQSVEMPGPAALVPSAQSKRLQDILLGCAAYFDESLLVKRLSKPDWLMDVANALENHAQSFCVIDTHLCRERIVYTNKAFNALTEFTPDDLRNVNLNVLNGPETEISQLLLLREAMKPMQTAKFAITFYTKSKRAFTDLVAVKTTAHYSVMVHFAAVKGANLDDLKEIDDLLILVSQLFEPPPAPQGSTPPSPQAASWLPAPLASIMHHLPSPRFLPSPSFLRSRSSSTSGSARSGGNGGGPGSAGGGSSGSSVGGASAGSGTPVGRNGALSGGTPTSGSWRLKLARATGARTDIGKTTATATTATTCASFSTRSANYRLEVSAEGTEELGAAEHIE